MARFIAILALLGACNGDNTNTGDTCAAPEDCFVDFSDTDLAGDRVCITDIEDGYCTHECTDDPSCCAAGQCNDDLAYFCEELESDPRRMCFVSCEDADGGEAVCDDLGPGFTCRNTGGGDGRKFCSP